MQHVIAMLLLQPLLLAAISVPVIDESVCRSNSTHIVWYNNDVTTTSRDLQQCQWQIRQEAEASAYHYLRQNVMPFDEPFLETMGFGTDATLEDLPDGLSSGMIKFSIQYALQAKIDFEYADKVPQHVWQEYVLNYANTNEARSNWRPLLWSKLRHVLDNNTDTSNSIDMSIAVYKLNEQLWHILAPKDTPSIKFIAGQTPLIFDPMSVLVYGYTSCTGSSILMINALRTFGIPARLVGTPAWHDKPESEGNHNWVEVYDYTNSKWTFFEPTLPPATNTDSFDHDPCERWFCNPDRFSLDENGNYTTKVYAARLTRNECTTHYPMAWETDNTGVPGEDVTERYYDTCGKCR